MVQEFVSFRITYQKFVVTKNESSQEEIHVKCTSNNKMEVFQLATIRLNHLFGKESFDSSKDTLV